jgi:hypothetical protein
MKTAPYHLTVRERDTILAALVHWNVAANRETGPTLRYCKEIAGANTRRRLNASEVQRLGTKLNGGAS